MHDIIHAMISSPRGPLGHPGGDAVGIARSADLSYWESLGSFLWETAGETTPPSLNDHIATGIGGTFLGEAMFRMASLVLEGGGEHPPFWRELGATLISPPTGFNRLVFGERFRSVFPSRDPALFLRLRLGVTLTTHVRNADLPSPTPRRGSTSSLGRAPEAAPATTTLAKSRSAAVP